MWHSVCEYISFSSKHFCFYSNLLFSKFSSQMQIITLFYKQLVSGLSLQNCLYFQGFRGSKLLNGCWVVWLSNLYFKVRNFRETKFRDFVFFFFIIFRKFAKVWNRKIFDSVALAKVNSRENVQFFGREKYVFLQKFLIII